MKTDRFSITVRKRAGKVGLSDVILHVGAGQITLGDFLRMAIEGIQIAESRAKMLSRDQTRLKREPKGAVRVRKAAA